MLYNQFYSATNTYLTIILAAVAVVGDYFVLHSKLQVVQAIFDNATHAAIGGISWLMFCVGSRGISSSQTLIEIALCTLLSSLIDVDHFLAAKSFYLKDATNLKSRPPLHCTTFPLVLGCVLLGFSYVGQLSSLKRCALLMLVAFISHHTRDATRRGYWMYPLGSTPPIPYSIYVLFTCFLPFFTCFVNRIFKIEHSYGVSRSNATVII